jgi:hypothetical protein
MVYVPLNSQIILSLPLPQQHTALEMYYAAMKVWQEHESHDVECDRVQRIHTLENLAELLMEGYGYDYSDDGDDDGEINSLDEEELYRQARELRSEFIKRSRGQVMTAEEAYVVCKRNVKEAQYEVHIHVHRIA